MIRAISRFFNRLTCPHLNYGVDRNPWRRPFPEWDEQAWMCENCDKRIVRPNRWLPMNFFAQKPTDASRFQ